MPRTIDWYKAGTTTVHLRVDIMVTLADAGEIGNTGIEGLDYEGFGADFSTVELAKEAAAELAITYRDALALDLGRTHAFVEALVLTTQRWEEDVFQSAEYGRVLDALPVDVSEIRGEMTNEVITWGEEEAV